MNVSWLFCVTFTLLIHTVSVQNVTVGVGETAILPCLLEQKGQNVYWRDKDENTVCDILDAKADFDAQDPAYRGRVEIFPLGIERGDFSIKLKNVKESDAGTYTCRIPSRDLTHKIELRVTDTVHSVPVVAVIGQTVILPCSVKPEPEYVLWKDGDDKTVCDIIRGEVAFDEQDLAYKGRVEIFPLEIGKGNFSIMLRNVMKTDLGLYTCHAPGSITLKVELTDNAESKVRQITPGSTASPRSSAPMRRADGVLTFLLGFALHYSLAF